jgi:hypothetical protein
VDVANLSTTTKLNPRDTTVQTSVSGAIRERKESRSGKTEISRRAEKMEDLIV